ncbi:hypothetical protein [Saccharothrix sp. NRRL B-16348]|uniref:hypothetical protein n=1 Tax=Saccharothrix sp. NRRL B-16348 TaxID=1415542 RepID=UPI000A4062B1|nr:hypothetical protein [Saccharothrix sp. NRRL B-16348]
MRVDRERARVVDLIALISLTVLSAGVYLLAGVEALIVVDAVVAGLYTLWRRGR